MIVATIFHRLGFGQIENLVLTSRGREENDTVPVIGLLSYRFGQKAHVTGENKWLVASIGGEVFDSLTILVRSTIALPAYIASKCFDGFSDASWKGKTLRTAIFISVGLPLSVALTPLVIVAQVAYVVSIHLIQAIASFVVAMRYGVESREYAEMRGLDSSPNFVHDFFESMLESSSSSAPVPSRQEKACHDQFAFTEQLFRGKPEVSSEYQQLEEAYQQPHSGEWIQLYSRLTELGQRMFLLFQEKNPEGLEALLAPLSTDQVSKEQVLERIKWLQSLIAILPETQNVLVLRDETNLIRMKAISPSEKMQQLNRVSSDILDLLCSSEKRCQDLYQYVCETFGQIESVKELVQEFIAIYENVENLSWTRLFPLLEEKGAMICKALRQEQAPVIEKLLEPVEEKQNLSETAVKERGKELKNLFQIYSKSLQVPTGSQIDLLLNGEHSVLEKLAGLNRMVSSVREADIPVELECVLCMNVPPAGECFKLEEEEDVYCQKCLPPRDREGYLESPVSRQRRKAVQVKN